MIRLGSALLRHGWVVRLSGALASRAAVGFDHCAPERTDSRQASTDDGKAEFGGGPIVTRNVSPGWIIEGNLVESDDAH